MSLGVKYILIAGLFFSVINAAVKYYSHIPSIEIVFFRSIVTLFISYYYVSKRKLKIFNKYSKLLFLRGAFGATALIMYFHTIQKIPLATAVTLLYLAPVFTVIFAIFITKEKPKPLQWPFILMSLSGAIVIKSFDPTIDFKYFVMGITSAIFAALAYNTIRLLKDKTDPQLIIFYFPLITIPICLPILIGQWVTPTLYDFLGLILIGVLTQLAQIFMTKAYMYSSASKISHFNYLTTVYALLCGIIFFNETITYSGIIGLALIIVGVILSSKTAS
ncbi:MAG: DMT family transporter [Bacteriovoracaceae bacterium]|jgi:drug/metabolite transporter (DMT)-like permease|nr:DMT family transporter [Bacteriovoracaceae bacterium]